MRDSELEDLMAETDPDKTDSEAIERGINMIKQKIIECDMTGMDYRWAFRKVKQLEGRMMDHSITKIVDGEKELTDPREMADVFTKTYADQFKFEDGEPTLQGIPDEDPDYTDLPMRLDEKFTRRIPCGTWVYIMTRS